MITAQEILEVATYKPKPKHVPPIIKLMADVVLEWAHELRAAGQHIPPPGDKQVATIQKQILSASQSTKRLLRIPRKDVERWQKVLSGVGRRDQDNLGNTAVGIIAAELKLALDTGGLHGRPSGSDPSKILYRKPSAINTKKGRINFYRAPSVPKTVRQWTPRPGTTR